MKKILSVLLASFLILLSFNSQLYAINEKVVGDGTSNESITGLFPGIGWLCYLKKYFNYR